MMTIPSVRHVVLPLHDMKEIIDTIHQGKWMNSKQRKVLEAKAQKKIKEIVTDLTQ
ncbi:MAG: hypothetical protein NT103_05030 [Campylobacterales bacterium]|nr:hypothetical protein [Campylobacterales bacterium]